MIKHIMPCMNLMEPLEKYMSPSQMGEGAWRDLRPIPLISRLRQPWPLQRSKSNWSAPWSHPDFHQECTLTTPRDTTSLKEWVNVWSPDKKPGLSSMISWSLRITWQSLYWWLQDERESGGTGSHQPPFPGWWDNLPSPVQKTARQQHHLCCWGYSHHLGTELLPLHGPSSPRCSSLLWLNILLAGNRGRTYWEPCYFPYHEPPLVIEWQRHTCAFLLDTETLWHRWKWKSRPASKRDPWPWQRPTCKCPPCRFEAIGQLLYPAAGSNQVGCGYTW